MSIESMTEAAAFMRERNVGPEAITVIVLSPDHDMARAVAPLLAKELHPSMRIGAVLHVETLDELSCEVAVEIRRRGRSDVT